MKKLLAVLLTTFLGGCVSGPPELTAEQLRKIGDLEIFRTGTAPKKEFKIIADIEAADCSGSVSRLYGDEGKAMDTLKMKAIEIGGDAIVDVSCKSVPFVNNCWAAKKCNGKAVSWNNGTSPPSLRSAWPQNQHDRPRHGRSFLKQSRQHSQ